MTTFVKTSDGSERLDQEVAGLRWLAEAEPHGGARVARILAVTSRRLELARVREVAPTAADARAFGAALARTHAAGAGWFGCPPAGWPGGSTIGRSRQPYVLSADRAADTWGEFYADQRIAVFAERMLRAGLIDTDQARVYQLLGDRLRSGAYDAPQPSLVTTLAARAHGDLWAGNVLWDGGPTGAVLIDPLARGDHAETDLGMLALFGLAHLNEVYAGYDEVSELAAGWRDRQELHALSPLMFHAILFGGGYAGQALQVARRFA